MKMKRRHFLWYSLLLIGSCQAATNQSSNSSSNSESGSMPEKLRFTITEVHKIEDLQRDYGALRTVLEEVLGKKIEFVTVESYTAAAASLQSDRIDLVLTGPSEYVVIRARTNASPVIAITRPNYRTVIAVNKNSKIKSVAELKSKKIALWEVGSTSGYLGPTKLLIDAGLDPKSDLKIMLMGSKGLPALKNGEIDAWGGSEVKYEKFLQDNGLSENDLPPIVRGPVLPSDLFVVSSKFDRALIAEISDKMVKNQNKLLQSLLSVEEGKYKGSQLVPALDSDYDMIREVYKAIGQGSFVQ